MQTYVGALSVSGAKGCSPAGTERREHLLKGNLHPAFRQMEAGRECFLYLCSQLPSSQNNSYARVACFEVTTSAAQIELKCLVSRV